MNTYFWASYVALWLLIIPLILLNLVLFREIGIMIMGTALGVHQSGIPRGKRIPSVSGTSIDGRPWSTEELRGSPTLLFFVSPTCSECSKIMPDLRGVQERFGVELTIFLFADDNEARRYMSAYDLDCDVLVVSPTLRSKLDVGVTPFAYGIDSQGVVRAKGLVNTRWQLYEMARAALGKATEVRSLTDANEEISYFSKEVGR